MSIIEFKLEPANYPGDSQGTQIRIYVDGVDYIQDFDHSLGLRPAELYRQDELLGDGRLIYAQCICGCLGCGDSILYVEREDNKVIWWRTGDPPIEFDAEQYAAALEEVKSDTSWEGEYDAFHRKVGESDFSGMKIEGWKFYSVSPKPTEGKITIWFEHKECSTRRCTVSDAGVSIESALSAITAWAPTASPKDFDQQ